MQVADKVISQDVQHLRIIDDASWKAVQRMRATASAHKLHSRRRPRRALSGLLSCGECNSSYIITQGEWCGCSAYKQRGTCANKRMIRMSEVERRVFEALKTKLMAPDTVAAAIEAHRVEHERLTKLHAKDRNTIEREIGEVKRRLARVMDSIETGDGELSELLPRQKELVAKRRELEARLPDKSTVVALHPNIATRYKQMVDNIQATLARGDAHAHEAVTLVRSLITKIVVRPEDDRMGLEVLGDLAVLFGARTDPEADNVSGGCGDRI
ncbi:MAG TPA: zinc ribbon domain-containing protein [Burkholderiales bacterium]|nr:zinc ribbon domain-containing protein [Burkholderiales bacterium]